ncbi:P-loop containing nucleoside triphosphate hydrolase protein [Pelagophyceae sp. CCMP2097]|nr:P-loop containing nucleoside triphosphate hydrolase protein [Pelagophyceae sp. CCMP2097]
MQRDLDGIEPATREAQPPSTPSKRRPDGAGGGSQLTPPKRCKAGEAAADEAPTPVKTPMTPSRIMPGSSLTSLAGSRRKLAFRGQARGAGAAGDAAAAPAADEPAEAPVTAPTAPAGGVVARAAPAGAALAAAPGVGAAMAAAPGAKVSRVSLVPGRSQAALPAHLVAEWGGCHRCKQLGHFIGDCPLQTRVVLAKFDKSCPLCGRRVVAGVTNLVRSDSNWVHVECHVDKLEKCKRAEADCGRRNMSEGAVIVNHVECGEGDALVDAVAGSGKTWVLVACAAAAAKAGKRALVLVYNKAAQADLEQRGAREAKTFHALGLAAWKAHVPRAAVDMKVQKQKVLLHALYPPSRADVANKAKKSLVCAVYDGFVQKVVAFAKMRCVGVGSEATVGALLDIARLYKLGDRLERHVDDALSEWRHARCLSAWPDARIRLAYGARLALEVLEAGAVVARESEWQGRLFLSSVGGKAEYRLPILDGDDMLYMPLRDNIELAAGRLDVLLVDEAQDSNEARREMVARLQRDSGCRVVAVGDAMQAIYGFAGADSDSLDLLDAKLGGGMKRFPLSTCWRCPKTHVALANRVIDDVCAEHEIPADALKRLRCKPGAAEGNVVRDADFTTQPLQGDRLLGALTKGAAPRRSERRWTTAVLCRMNAPLLALRGAFAARGVACVMVGLESLAKKLQRLLRKIDAQSLGELKDALDVRTVHDDDESEDDDDDDDEPKTSTKLEACDIVDCLTVLIQALEHEGGNVDVSAVEKRVVAMYSEGHAALNDDAVTLSSVHRSKGLEWDRVYVLEPKLLPLGYLMEYGSAADRRQERNAEYVAKTRAKEDLIFLRNLNVGGGDWREGVQGLWENAPTEAPEAPPPPAPPRAWHESWRDFCSSQEQEQQDADCSDGSDDGSTPADEGPTVGEALRDLGLAAAPADLKALRRARVKRLLLVHPDKQAGKAQPLDTQMANDLCRRAVAAFNCLRRRLLDAEDRHDGEGDDG